jgi:GT2 family glycosyltransferase
MRKKSILIAILIFKQHSYILNLLKSLERQKGNYILKYYIGDICPTEEEKKQVNEVIKKLTLDDKSNYIIFDYNTGYAKGNNTLIKRAILEAGEKYDYILVTNPDIYLPQDDTIEKLVENLEKKENLAIAGPKIINFGKLQGPYLKLNPWTFSLKYLCPIIYTPILVLIETYFRNIKKPRRVWRVIGAFMLIKAKYFIEIGLFEENTFLYCEEDLIAYKLRKKEYFTIWVPNTIVLHLKKFNEPNINMLEKSLAYALEKMGYSKIAINISLISVNVYSKIWLRVLKKVRQIIYEKLKY